SLRRATTQIASAKSRASIFDRALACLSLGYKQVTHQSCVEGADIFPSRPTVVTKGCAKAALLSVRATLMPIDAFVRGFQTGPPLSPFRGYDEAWIQVRIL